MNVKNSIKYIAGVALVGVMGLNSCSQDFVELNPQTSQTVDNFYQTRDDAFNALMGAYEPLRSDRSNSYEPLQMFTDLISDDAYAGGGSASDMQSFQDASRFKDNSYSSVSLGLWQKCYRGISRANSLLENYNQINFKPTQAADKIAFKAEAMALRGHYYFELARFFENVPLYTNTLDGVNWTEVKQATPDETYAQIGKDMLTAIDSLPASYGSGYRGRLTKWAIMAEMVKVYMFYSGYYGKTEMPVLDGAVFTADKARIMLDEIIESSGHGLHPEGYADLFTANGDYSIEAVFEIPFGNTASGDWDSDSPLGNIGCQMSGPRDYNGILSPGWSFGIPSHELHDAFEDGDIRKEATIATAKRLIEAIDLDPASEAGQTAITPGYTHTGLFAFKYTTHAANRATDGSYELNWAQNYHYIRFSDVLLMAAELYLDTDPSKAALYVNQVRNRAGLGSLSSVNLDAIYHERRVELGMEGHRYFDVLRRGVAYAKQELDDPSYTLRAPEVAGNPLTGDIGNAADFSVTFDEGKKGFLAIPQAEIDLNGNLKQNAGY